MFVEPSRSAQPRPAPQTPIVSLLTPSPAEPDSDPDVGSHTDLEPPRAGVVRHDRTTATSTFRLRNGAEITLGGSFGDSRGVWSNGPARPRRRQLTR
ncbi:hypothetical protein [Curtobacterium sp. SGAir0471]|uniref:hypothetical protein n=1 Tax=Curtobacterium sp. SGAir0471 TaxID=2070337 RepID=UPI0010F73D95|nr:hypothetical protein [Curtobacterium sp. SGAir0471]